MTHRSEDEGIDTDDALTQQLDSPSTCGDDKHPASKPSKTARTVINGRITKARKSPRAAIRQDHIARGDPLVGGSFANSDREKIFPTDPSGSEDSILSDNGYDTTNGDSQAMEAAV